MHGNVWEWTLAVAYGGGLSTPGMLFQAGDQRSAVRFLRQGITDRNNNVGFASSATCNR
jgi:hypothetical protein